MLKYIARRILFFIPALFVISLLAFVINALAPGDPTERLLPEAGAQAGAPGEVSKQRAYWRQKLGLDLPVFYVSLNTLSRPAGFGAGQPPYRRQTAERLLRACGNDEAVTRYMNTLYAAEQACRTHAFPGAHAMAQLLYDLGHTGDPLHASGMLDELERLDRGQVVYGRIKTSFDAMEGGATRWKNYIPALRLHPDNRYHRWLFGDGKTSRGIVRGDFGVSYTTREPIGDIIGKRMYWSVMLALLAIALAYLVSIPVGIRAAVRPRSRFDRASSVTLFFLYALPVFWVATLLLMTFANPEVLHLLPASGVAPPQGFPEGTGFWGRLLGTLPYLVLPVVCYTYGSLAFLARTMRGSMAGVLQSDYIRTARAKGLSENRILYRHALRNALLPMITMFANVFPLAISGSVIVETIFSIPGMGLETYQAILNLDYPMISAVFTLTGVLTLTGYLLADVLYAAADPRITLKPERLS